MTTINLEAKQFRSRVLDTWALSRPGIGRRVENMQVTTGVSSDAEAMRAIFQPLPSASGFPVTAATAKRTSTVYACLAKLSGAVSQLPVYHYRYNTAGDRDRVLDSPLHWLLNESPSDAWTAASWKEYIVDLVCLRGDQYTRILRSNNVTGGKIIGFLPLHADTTSVRRVGSRLAYDVIGLDGKMTTYDQDDILHFCGMGFDGLKSPSIIQTAARQGIGNALAGAEYIGRSIGEGAMPQIALEFPKVINSTQAQTLRDSFVATYTGPEARKLPLVLTEGGKATVLGISPVDMQLLQSRQFEKEDICQAFGVPPVLIGDNTKTSSWGTGIEQITIGFVRYTIKPMLKRWEEEMNRKIFRNAGQFIEFDLDSLLKGDTKTQAEVDRSSLGGPGTGDGIVTPNEIRRRRNMPPLPGGDELYKAQRGTDTTAVKPAAPAPAEPVESPDPAEPPDPAEE